MNVGEKKIVIISFVVMTFITLFFCIKKQGMFTDEIYTYGLANSYYAPYIADIFDGNLIDKVVSSADLFSYVTVNPNERFKFDSVFFNQAHDTLPPLYYCVIHFISSLFPNTFSKWFGLSINIVFYVCCLLALLKLTNKIFKNARISLIVVIFYGLSFVGLSTMLMIRMYVLLTLLTVLLAYYSICLIEKQNLKYCIIISLINYLGMMTHYYYAIYAIFIFIFCSYYLIVQKGYKFTFSYFVFYVLGILIFIISFPAFVDQLLASKLVSGNTAYINLLTLSKYYNILVYLFLFIRQTPLMHIFLGLIVGYYLFQKKKTTVSVEKKSLDNQWYSIVVIPAILSLFLISVISPIIATRYIYNIIPFLCIIVAKELSIIQCINTSEVKLHNKTVIVLLLINFVYVLFNPPRYLYSDNPNINSLLKGFSDNPCVFVDNNYSSPITENLLQLMQFKNFIVINDVNSKTLKDYIQKKSNNNNIVLYIDTNKFFSSGYEVKEVIKKIKSNYGYASHKRLYSNYSVEVYFLAK